MNRRSLFAVALVLFAALGVVMLSLSATALASARLHTTPVVEPPAPRFTSLDYPPEQLPPDLRAALSATARVPHSPSAAPDVRLGKWTQGNQARPGGVMVYGIYFDNNGDADALNVIITDTLPVSTTYAGDASGLPVSSAGGLVTWTIGTLPAGTWSAFNITLNVDPGVSTGSTLDANCARISTVTSGDDPGNNEGCSGGVDVVNDSIDIQVQTWPGGFFDAAAGQEFPFDLQVCNFNGTPVGPVRITDTLPLSTTFSRWESNSFWPRLWKQISVSSSQVVLEAPGLPANTCDDVTLYVLVDAAAPQSTRLLNQLSGYTPGDADPNNNDASNAATYVRVPRIDLSTQRRVSWDTFGFEVDIVNAGNIAVPALMTDTLPLSTTYRSGSGSCECVLEPCRSRRL